MPISESKIRQFLYSQWGFPIRLALEATELWLLWNWLAPRTFGLGTIEIWEAAGWLLLVAGLKGFDLRI